MLESSREYEWVQIDELGVLTGGAFSGSFDELRAHLLRDLPEATVIGTEDGGVYVRRLAARVHGPLVTLATPWGRNRWIPEPPRRVRRDRRAWLRPR